MAAPTGRIYVKFDIGDFFENLLRNFGFGYNRAKYGALHVPFIVAGDIISAVLELDC